MHKSHASNLLYGPFTPWLVRNTYIPLHSPASMTQPFRILGIKGPVIKRGGGLQNEGGGGQVKFYLYKEGGGRGTSFKFAEGAGGQKVLR